MTHNERVLQLLSDGKPHSHHELYQLHVIAHSRVSDLRKRGYEIEQWRDGDLYLYRLLSEGVRLPVVCLPSATPPSENRLASERLGSDERERQPVVLTPSASELHADTQPFADESSPPAPAPDSPPVEPGQLLLLDRWSVGV